MQPENSQQSQPLEQQDAQFVKYPSPVKQSRWRRISTVLLIVMFAITFWQRQNIVDWWQLQNYTPTVEAAQLATQSSMTDLGRRIFYLQKPQVQEKAVFYVSCEENEATIVLGCYKPGSGIYLLRVTDARLNGVEQVTAAHEMLHAAYARLGYQEKKRVDSMVSAAYANTKDTAIRDKIKQYQISNADIPNELHSILATEVTDLPDDLEQYYARYFTNRDIVVKYAVSYTSEFLQRKAKVQTLDKQLTELEATVASNNTKLKSQQASIQAESRRLDNLLSLGKTDEYNQGVVAYNNSLVPYRALLRQTQQLISQYEQILGERNKVASEAQELEKALDSRIKPAVDNI